MQNAQFLIVNHALFFSDLGLRRQGASILPDYDLVVFDEAHNIESVASDHLGVNLSSGQIEYVLSKLYNERTNRGLLVHHRLAEAQQQVQTWALGSSPRSIHRKLAVWGSLGLGGRASWPVRSRW